MQAAYGVQDLQNLRRADVARNRTIRGDCQKLPSETTPADLKLMLQALLAEPFQVVVHNAEQPLSVNAITLAKDGLLKEGTGEPGCSGATGNGPSAYFTIICRTRPWSILLIDFAALWAHVPWWI
jgi:uncharacterized protein (TIGR03435 family)